ncbi:MAG: hypothetical protein AAF978_03910 [Cyanobacteria bacterium P01_E01_bin.48]
MHYEELIEEIAFSSRAESKLQAQMYELGFYVGNYFRQQAIAI